jgi:hypothetical protein
VFTFLQIIETCNEEGYAVLTQETVAWRKWEMEHMTRLSAPWTDTGGIHWVP